MISLLWKMQSLLLLLWIAAAAMVVDRPRFDPTGPKEQDAHHHLEREQHGRQWSHHEIFSRRCLCGKCRFRDTSIKMAWVCGTVVMEKIVLRTVRLLRTDSAIRSDGRPKSTMLHVSVGQQQRWTQLEILLLVEKSIYNTMHHQHQSS